MAATIARTVPPGSTIGSVTPGSPPEGRAEVGRGIAWWRSHGYQVKLAPGALERDDWRPVAADAGRLTVTAIAGGTATGPLVGGCLGDLIYTIGTAWEPSLEGAILFFEEVLEGRLGHLDVPILYGLPLGHGSSLATLPLGVDATVDANALTLTIDKPALRTS